MVIHGIVDRSYTLTKDSPFYMDSPHTDNGITYPYYYFISFGSIGNDVNGNKWAFWLTYPNYTEQYTIVYNMEYSFSSAIQDSINDNTQQDIDKTLNNIDTFVSNDNIDNDSIVNIIEDLDINIDYTGSNLLDSLFTLISNAFTSNNSVDFVFTIPNSNQTITIPANYIETHLPSVIVTLIRAFYWYMICVCK